MIVMWGSNARNAHPIFFHHVLTAIHNGAKLYCVDPRRSETAQFADRWLGLHVGTDIALSNTIAREIIHAGLANTVVHRARHHRLRRVRGIRSRPGRSTRRAGHRRTRRRDPRARPRLRHGERGAAVLDARHHRAPQRRRQRRSRCATSRSSPARSVASVPVSPRCAARTTCRAAATWVPCPTSCPDSRTSPTTSPAPSSTPSGARRYPPRTVGTSPRCSRRWSTTSCARCS